MPDSSPKSSPADAQPLGRLCLIHIFFLKYFHNNPVGNLVKGPVQGESVGQRALGLFSFPGQSPVHFLRGNIGAMRKKNLVSENMGELREISFPGILF